jgi:creatinine amidohydrolase
MTFEKRLWQELTTEAFAGPAATPAVALLPVGAIEQHGPHLPLGVDTLIIEGILARALSLAEADLPLVVLPTQPVGKSDEHVAFPGTLSLPAETLARVWIEIGRSVARAGVRRLILFNGHGGQVAVMDIVARELRIQERMLVMAWSWFAAGVPPGLFADEEVRTGIHAGAIETSIMLHLRPDLVRADRAAHFEPLMARMAREGYRRLSPVGAGRMGWMAQDLHPAGACGDATDADPERGRLLVEHAAQALLELVREMARFPLERLRDEPL